MVCYGNIAAMAEVHGVLNANHQPGNVDLDQLLVDWVLEDNESGGSNSQECVPGCIR